MKRSIVISTLATATGLDPSFISAAAASLEVRGVSGKDWGPMLCAALCLRILTPDISIESFADEKSLTLDEARRIASNIAKLPDLLGKVRSDDNIQAVSNLSDERHEAEDTTPNDEP